MSLFEKHQQKPIWSMWWHGVYARAEIAGVSPPPSFQKSILLTLTTSSSVERHVAASETSVTEASVPTVTTFTGTATVFPVNTAVFRISESWRYKKKTEIKAKKQLESNSLEMKVNHLWINLQTNNWWISYLILSFIFPLPYLQCFS